MNTLSGRCTSRATRGGKPITTTRRLSSDVRSAARIRPTIVPNELAVDGLVLPAEGPYCRRERCLGLNVLYCERWRALLADAEDDDDDSHVEDERRRRERGKQSTREDDD